MILCIKDTNDSTRKSLKLLNKFIKEAGFKNITLPIIKDKHIKKEIGETIPFAIKSLKISLNNSRPMKT